MDKPSIALIGMMGAGKTRIGRELGERLGWRFVDLDRWIEGQEGCSVTELFANRGEDHFRDLESVAMRYWSQESEVILATGGGVVQRVENRLSIRQNYRIVYLEASLDTLWSRVRRSCHRPLLRVENPQARLRALLHARLPLYGDWADLAIRTDERTVAAIADEIIERLDLEGPYADSKR